MSLPKQVLLVVSLFLAAAPTEPVAAQSHEVPDMHPMRRVFVQSEVLEYAPAVSGDPVRYDLLGWVGADVNRLWFKADGDHETREGAGEAEFQALYGRLISPYFDVQAGVRLDVLYGEGVSDMRAHLAAGLQGLAQYWFEIEPTVFLSQSGDISASLAAAYHMLLSQRLILEPQLEMGFALQEVPEFGVGSGVNDVEFGIRLRYEVLREIAPYVGFLWTRRLGGAADLARDAGEAVAGRSFIAGLRLWY